MRSGLPDGLVFWFCHGDVRLVYRRFKDGYMVRYIVGYMVWYLVGVRVWYIVDFLWYGTLLVSK